MIDGRCVGLRRSMVDVKLGCYTCSKTLILYISCMRITPRVCTSVLSLLLYCTVYYYCIALFIITVLHWLLLLYCTVYYYCIALFIITVLHCLLLLYCTLYYYCIALFIITVLHCLLLLYCTVYYYCIALFINPRRMRSEGYCNCRVCVSVCLLFDNSLHEWLFASKTNTHIQRRMEVKKYVGFSLKLLRSRVMA